MKSSAAGRTARGAAERAEQDSGSKAWAGGSNTLAPDRVKHVLFSTKWHSLSTYPQRKIIKLDFNVVFNWGTMETCARISRVNKRSLFTAACQHTELSTLDVRFERRLLSSTGGAVRPRGWMPSWRKRILEDASVKGWRRKMMLEGCEFIPDRKTGNYSNFSCESLIFKAFISLRSLTIYNWMNVTEFEDLSVLESPNTIITIINSSIACTTLLFLISTCIRTKK